MKKAVIDFGKNIIRTALVEDERLVELVPAYYGGGPEAGDIYTGTVKRILKSGFAFVDIGEEKNAFLYFTDKREESLWKNGRLGIKEGDSLTVQILKISEGKKGAAASSALSLKGSLCVVVMGRGDVRVSRKITSEEKRKELRAVFEGDGAFSDFDIVIRTKAADSDPSEVRKEAAELIERIRAISQKALFRKPPARVYKTEPTALLAIKSFSPEKITVNDIRKYYEYIDRERLFEPEPYEGDIPIFREFLIESKAEKALSPRVWLKSGGHIVIEPTEAMVVVDVNSGKNNTRSHEKTAFATNMEAAAEILHQLRLRNLSGTVIIDFINMNDEKNNNDLVSFLREEAKKDRLSVTIIGMTALGLVILTRKREGLPIARYLTAPCSVCGGRGYREISPE